MNKAETFFPPRGDRLWRFAEIGLIFLLFFLQAGVPAPDVNEAHYLGKAKHFWNPAWCAGDRFFESADAHIVFYGTLGLLTKWFELPAAAWLGRAIVWLFAAIAWARLCRAVAPDARYAWLAAATALMFWFRFHLAGEWVIGGVEAKAPAYGFVFLAAAAAAENRFPRAFLWAGAAAAFHVLVGGWMLVALGLAWLVAGRDRPSWRAMTVAGVLAMVIAAPGWWPALALTRGIPPDVVQEANRIYVYERLSHHLVFHRFDHGFMLRFAILACGWIWLWRFGCPSESLRRIYAVCAGAMFIAAVGIAIDQMLLFHPDLAAKLLRYYFYRLADAILPIAVALGLWQLFDRWRLERPSAATGLLTVLLLGIGLHFGTLGWERNRERLPPGVLQSLPRPRSAPLRLWGPEAEWANEDEPAAAEAALPRPVLTTEAERREWYRQWRLMTAWVAAETEPHALFLTPRSQQTFKWYAGRPEVVNWKDIPQDAASMVRWFEVWNEIHPWENSATGLAGHSDARLRELGAKYGAKYLVIDCTRYRRTLSFAKVYPETNEADNLFAVYRLPPEDAVSR